MSFTIDVHQHIRQPRALYDTGHDYLGSTTARMTTNLSAHKKSAPVDDRATIEQAIQRIIIKAEAIDIHLYDSHSDGVDSQKNEAECAEIVSVPRTPATNVAVKGITIEPPSTSAISSDERDILLTAIAKARMWIDDLVERRIDSFAAIAKREGKVERHIRLLAPLAFVSPHSVSNIIDGSTSSTAVTELAKRVPHSWKLSARPRKRDDQQMTSPNR
jgi:site-specific DNA recombinase